MSAKKTGKPVALKKGDLIGVVSPGAAVDPQALERGVACLEAAGFRVRLGQAVLRRNGYLAGSDAERLADLREVYTDPEVKAVIAARGGYGCGRLLSAAPIIRPDDPVKAFVGHSDLTFLLTDLVQRSRMVAFHGPLVAGLDASSPAVDALTDLLTGNQCGWQQQASEVIRPGTASGVLVGGCLSIITAMVGTPYAVATRHRLLFLEEVNEKPYRIDRMLVQLRQAGALDEVAGVIFGEMPGCSAGPGEAVSVRDVIAEVFRDAPYPVAFGVPSGHGRGTAILPFGVRAQLSADRLILLESPFTVPSA